MSYKTKQFFFVLIKLGIVVGAIYFIYSKLVENENLKFSDFTTFLTKNNVFSPKNLILLVLLSICNWSTEILKWQHLVKIIKPISFTSALEQSLGGLTAALITPNRIGDYGAKAIYYTKSLRTKIVLLNLLGNMAQMAITTIIGSIGLLFFVSRYSIAINYTKALQFSAIILIIGILLWILTTQKRFKIKGFSFTTLFRFYKLIPLKTYSITLSLSLLRYLIFSFQLFYLLLLFKINLNYFDAMMIISSMYLLASIIPSISFFDVVIKGSVAVFLFDFIGVNDLLILSITTLMWLLNFVIPSLFGSYFVLHFKFPKPIEL